MRYPVILGVAASALLGCAASQETPETAVESAVPAERTPDAADSANVRDAELVFRHFLEASREGYRGAPVQWDTLVGCDGSSGPSFPVFMMARYEVLPSVMRGDTVLARAMVVSVGEQEADDRRPGRYIAYQRVRTDTLEWDVLRDGASGRWLVCNGLRFGFVGADSLTTWRGQDASFQSARSLAAMMYADPR